MLRIDVHRLLSRNTFTYRLDVENGPEHWTGRAQMVCRPVFTYQHAKHFPTDAIYETCLHCGLKTSEWIGHLRIFYPNGDAPSLERMRMGVGSAVLCTVCADLAAAGGLLLYALPTTPSMLAFLKKKRFVSFAAFPDQFFLPLAHMSPEMLGKPSL